MKYKKKLLIHYKYLDEPKSEQILEDVFDQIITKLMIGRKKLKEELKSEPYMKLYKKLRKDKRALADFILYD
jgi:hypothetical protein